MHALPSTLSKPPEEQQTAGNEIDNHGVPRTLHPAAPSLNHPIRERDVIQDGGDRNVPSFLRYQEVANAELRSANI